MIERLVWLKDGNEIDLNKMKDKYELKAVGTKFTLILKKAQFEDEGKITVNIRNSDATSSALLSVTGLNKLLLKLCINKTTLTFKTYYRSTFRIR